MVERAVASRTLPSSSLVRDLRRGVHARRRRRRMPTTTAARARRRRVRSRIRSRRSPATRSSSLTAFLGDGLRFNNPYRLATPLGDDAESLSRTAPYVDVGLAATFGNPLGFQHGAALRTSAAVAGRGSGRDDAVVPRVATVALARASTGARACRSSLTPDVTWGLEAGARRDVVLPRRLRRRGRDGRRRLLRRRHAEKAARRRIRSSAGSSASSSPTRCCREAPRGARAGSPSWSSGWASCSWRRRSATPAGAGAPLRELDRDRYASARKHEDCERCQECGSAPRVACARAIRRRSPRSSLPRDVPAAPARRRGLPARARGGLVLTPTRRTSTTTRRSTPSECDFCRVAPPSATPSFGDGGLGDGSSGTGRRPMEARVSRVRCGVRARRRVARRDVGAGCATFRTDDGAARAISRTTARSAWRPPRARGSRARRSTSSAIRRARSPSEVRAAFEEEEPALLRRMRRPRARARAATSPICPTGRTRPRRSRCSPRSSRACRTPSSATSRGSVRYDDAKLETRGGAAPRGRRGDPRRGRRPPRRRRLRRAAQDGPPALRALLLGRTPPTWGAVPARREEDLLLPPPDAARARVPPADARDLARRAGRRGRRRHRRRRRHVRALGRGRPDRRSSTPRRRRTAPRPRSTRWTASAARSSGAFPRPRAPIRAPSASSIHRACDGWEVVVRRRGPAPGDEGRIVIRGCARTC